MSLSKINQFNKQQISYAGPRYTPTIDPDAPNMRIERLAQSFDALGFTEDYKNKFLEFEKLLIKSWSHAGQVKRIFYRRSKNPEAVIILLKQIQSATPANVEKTAKQLETLASFVNKKLSVYSDRLWELEYQAEEDKKSKYQSLRNDCREVISAFGEIIEYLQSTAFRVITKNLLFLYGHWGTGKTHLFCDVANQRMQTGLPTIFFMAHHLPTTSRESILTTLCKSYKISANEQSLLKTLQKQGKKLSQRALILIDGINESDREWWKQQLVPLAELIERYPNIAVAISCRTPYENQFLNRRVRSKYVLLQHPGFEDIEFDAQIEFFKYYDIPLPQYPLLTPEFSRPLFLKLVCEAFQNLSSRSKKRKFKDIASGQKGMTYVFEYFIRNIGKRIEQDLDLKPGIAWKILKGAKPNNDGIIAGVAVTMAEENRDYMWKEECEDLFRVFLKLDKRQIKKILKRFMTDGLLAEDLIWWDGGYKEIVRLPYQKFSDHLIARYLLATHLSLKNKNAIKRSFNKDRPLGKVFLTDDHEHYYRWPGIAEAIMLEFPERVKNILPKEERELLVQLPKRNRKTAAFEDVFLDGLMWRSSDCISKQTDHILNFLLTQNNVWTQHHALETACGLATRPGHPYSGLRLYNYLKDMSAIDRDLYWTEFTRNSTRDSSLYRLLEWIEHQDPNYEEETCSEIIPLLSLCLTSINAEFRDRATRAIYLLGCQWPNQLYDHTLRTLEFNDIYVPERMLAACYGVAMTNWADKKRRFTKYAPQFAKQLYKLIFSPKAPYGTRHELLREYALGFIELTRRLEPNFLATQYVKYIRPPFAHMDSLFPQPSGIRSNVIEKVKGALHMDFRNYTLGRLVPDRGNYDDQHPGYKGVLKQIKWRIAKLGYSDEDFKDIDREIARTGFYREQQHLPKIDRYGKKYSWIAYFELYGLRKDQGLLKDEIWDEDRPSDCDIDPSFPLPAKKIEPSLKDIFSKPFTDPLEWLKNGPEPNYRSLLRTTSIDNIHGPWVLLNGHITERAKEDSREVFSFLRGFFVSGNVVANLNKTLKAKSYPGNHQIPDAHSDYYTFAGEIPWSKRYSPMLRDTKGKPKRHLEESFESYEQKLKRHKLRKPLDDIDTSKLTVDEFAEILTQNGIYHWNLERISNDGRYYYTKESHRMPGIMVEVPICGFSWESYHSAMNQVSGIEFPAPAICDHLKLYKTGRELDLIDSHNQPATIYREFYRGDTYFRSNLLYLREDLLNKYLADTNQVLIWMIWGERGIRHDIHEIYEESVREELQKDVHIHKKFYQYQEGKVVLN